ncbi:MAG: caspase family protein [Acidobacteriota bacterium]|nr:caspase family protein [Acidobacteriota bacterium]
MKSLKALALAILLIAMAITTATLVMTRPHTPADAPSESRSVGPVHLASVPAEYSRAESTGLFVGVQRFRHDNTLTVPYAVDDAIDLAHKFSLDPRVGLVPPRRVVLALSGAPEKDESEQRLRELKEAGARVEDATSGDILNLLKEQVAQAGTSGMLVFSLATHGFVDEQGDAYILGSTSTIGSTETSLRTANLFDIAGQTTRSLIFVDACRDRIGQTSRGATPDPATAAPAIRKMSRVHGQAIFYAAAPEQYAYDDDVHRNGVFSKAVLDGISCGASAPRGEVIVATLHIYVEREVRRWIQKNRKRPVNHATQISMEGETRNIPIANCRRRPGRCSRASVDGSTITVYDNETRPLWRKDLETAIVHAEVADLDADALCEVVVGFRDRITVLNRDGRVLWSKSGQEATLQTFTTGDLFRKYTKQIVALWNDDRASTSSLTIIDSTGKELSTYDHAGQMKHAAIGRPTNMHAPKIAVATIDTLLLLDPKKLSNRAPLWRQELLGPDTILNVRIVEIENSSRREIAVTTKSGKTWFSFEGKVLRQRRDGTSKVEPQWRNASKRRNVRDE